MSPSEDQANGALARERLALLRQLDEWLEIPLIVLGFVWLALLVMEFTWGLSALLTTASMTIWVVFIVDFLLKFSLAPHKLVYLRHNWLTAISLIVPALRVIRVVRLVRLLQTARAARSLQLLRVVSSTNRGMTALRASMGRRGFSYVVILTVLVTLAGGAGMYVFERDVPQGLDSFGGALWWTAMIMTALGSDYWPQTAEGRVLALLLALYAKGVFGYATASLATFFVGRDAANPRAEIASEESLVLVRTELAALRGEIKSLREATTEQLRANARDGNE